MKALVRAGLGLALGVAASGLAASPSFAQDWRPKGTAIPTQSPSTITPVAYSTMPTSQAIGLGRPVAASPQPDPEPMPAFRAREPGVARAKPDDLPLQPLPIGIPVSQKKSDGKEVPKTDAPKTEPAPMPLNQQFVPGQPTIVQQGPVSEGVIVEGEGGEFGGGGWLVGRRPGPLAMLLARLDSTYGLFPQGFSEDPAYYRGVIWFDASLLAWSMQKKDIPPLVAAAPRYNLFDQGSQESQWHYGGRFSLGIWLPRGDLGLEANWFTLNQQEVSSVFQSNGMPQLVRPVLGTAVNAVIVPPGGSASIGVNSSSRMWGLELNVRQKFVQTPRWWIDFLAGYRHVNLYEDLAITSAQNYPAPDMKSVAVNDSFQTSNSFDGLQIGVQGERKVMNHWFVGGGMKLAMGNMYQCVNINGTTATGTGLVTQGGFLAQPSNIGSVDQNHFAVVPEFNFKFGYDITDRWRAWVGYDVLYLSTVVRPGDQIDRFIVPGTARPTVPFKTASFWAQGVSCGMEYRW